MDTSRPLCKRVVTFKCGARITILALTEADLDEEEAKDAQQDCFKCQIEDGTISDEILDRVAASVAYGYMQAERQADVARSRVN